MGDDALSEVRAKIERAKKHVSDLEAEIVTFKETNSYLAVPYDDPQSGEFGVKVKIVRQIPYHWAAIIGDAIHNLRSSLDLLACALVLAGGGTPVKSTYFPISKDRETLESSAAKKLAGASQDAIALVKTLQPYQGGDGHILWQIHKLDILDKHTLIVPVGAAFAGLLMQVRMPPFPGESEGILMPWIRLTPADRMFPLVDGSILMEGSPEARKHPVDANYQFALDIAFGEGQIVDGEPVVPTLKGMTQSVEGIVATFAKEIFGIT